jgi:histidyl-tRNA synthetase
MNLRSAGWTASFSYKTANLSKQLKEAAEQNAKACVIIGSEMENQQLTVKNMATGEQELVDFGKFCQQCRIEGR